MIVTKLLGGLGNQMFQYAVGRAYSLKNNTTLTLDISGFDHYTLHQGFELQRVFKGSFNIAVREDVREVLGWQAVDIFRRYLQNPRMAMLRKRSFVVEPFFHYWTGINHIPHSGYLIGYWQSERYFIQYAKEIREDFTFNIALHGQNLGLAAEIAGSNAISLHIRRGDYVSHSETANLLGCCSLQYYQNAVNYIAEQVKNPCFFIFSDDIPWVEANLTVNFPCQFIGHNRGENSYMDMHLMSLCKHHIIANSSFSWWGAWLNKHKEKVVVAPKRWFKDEAMECQARDIVPEGWVRL